MATKEIKKSTKKKHEVKKLSKVGEWLESGKSALKIVDMKAALKQNYDIVSRNQYMVLFSG